jgi:hypothetical protein
MSATILLINLIYQLYRLFALQIAKNFIQPNMKEKVKFVYASRPESILSYILYLLIGGTIRGSTLIPEFSALHPSD